MLKLKTSLRLALTIGALCALIAYGAIALTLIEDPSRTQVKNRVQTTKVIALTTSSMAERNLTHHMNDLLGLHVETNIDLVSANVRRSNGRMCATAGPHAQYWKPSDDGAPVDDQYVVDILSNGRLWGNLELVFQSNPSKGLFQFPFPLVAFLASSLTLLTWMVLGRTFKYLNPSKVVPKRVRSALDTLAEGLVLVSPSGEIAHANEAFTKIVNVESEEICGMKLNDFGWLLPEGQEDQGFSWKQCQIDNEPLCGQILDLNLNGSHRKYIVNATPIISDEGKNRGVLVSFDDVTAMEQKKSELASMISTLRTSRDEISKQNEQLTFLASYDPLTKCMNRRTFFAKYDALWESVAKNELHIVMVDVDHFKKINDNHGHSVGDDVLRETGQLLREQVGDNGLVCRYGGEEFVILLPDTSIENATELAEKVRFEFTQVELGGLSVTVSVGLSCREFGAMDCQHMLDQADQCLYAAKRNGRNQMVRFDRCQEMNLEEEKAVDTDSEVQYATVTGLLSALSFKCSDTAQHSMRVADMSVAVGRSLLTKRELYKLEISALLHDIGKIGVPDSILQKPGLLTEEEWQLMRLHDKMGVEIVRSALVSEEIAAIIENHHHLYNNEDLVSGTDAYQQIPLSSKIITACDAFDAMVTNHVYREGIEVEEAIKELVRCTPYQFDPEIVDLLTTYVRSSEFVLERNRGVVTKTRSAVVIGQHIENLYEALEDNDISRLKEVVTQLRDDTKEQDVKELNDAAIRFGEALDDQAAEFDHLLAMADEVMGLCRQTRATFVSQQDLQTR